MKSLTDYPEKTTGTEKQADFYKFAQGSNVVRLVPDINGDMVMPLRVHWVGKYPHRCTNFNSELGKYDNKSCQYCRNKVDTNQNDQCVVLIPSGEVRFMNLKATIREQLLSTAGTLKKLKKIQSVEDVNSPTNGVWIDIVKSGSGIQGTKYSVSLADDESLPDDVTEMLDKVELPDLSKLYPAEDKDEQIEVLMDNGEPKKTSKKEESFAVEDDDDDVPF